MSTDIQSQTIDVNDQSDTYTVKSSGTLIYMIIAIVIFVIFLIGANTAVLYYFFGNATRTGKNLLRSNLLKRFSS